MAAIVQPLLPDLEARTTMPFTGLHVVNFEDELSIQRVAQRYIERFGGQYKGFSVASGFLRELIDTNLLHPWTVALVDNHDAGNRTWADLFGRILIDGKHIPPQRFIFTSGREDTLPSIQHYVQQGALYLSKPWTLEELRAAIEATRPV